MKKLKKKLLYLNYVRRRIGLSTSVSSCKLTVDRFKCLVRIFYLVLYCLNIICVGGSHQSTAAEDQGRRGATEERRRREDKERGRGGETEGRTSKLDTFKWHRKRMCHTDKRNFRLYLLWKVWFTNDIKPQQTNRLTSSSVKKDRYDSRNCLIIIEKIGRRKKTEEETERKGEKGTVKTSRETSVRQRKAG